MLEIHTWKISSYEIYISRSNFNKNRGYFWAQKSPKRAFPIDVCFKPRSIPIKNISWWSNSSISIKIESNQFEFVHFKSNQRFICFFSYSFAHKIAFNFQMIRFKSSCPADFHGSNLLFSGRLNVTYQISWFTFHRLKIGLLRKQKTQISDSIEKKCVCISG